MNARVSTVSCAQRPGSNHLGGNGFHIVRPADASEEVDEGGGEVGGVGT